MLNNNSILELFVFLTYCFASGPTKLHRVFSHLIHLFAIYVQHELNLFFRQNNDVCWRKEKYLLFSPVNKSTLQVECWQAVDGILFQLINGTSVFLGVLQSAVAEQAGNGLDVGTIVEDVHGEGMASAMPADMLVDAGTLHPPLNGLTAAFV